MLVLMYSSETMIWKEKEKYRIRSVQMDNLRRLLNIRRMDKVPNVWIIEFCGVTKGVDERIDEGVLRCFGHVERMENDRISNRVFVREYAGSFLDRVGYGFRLNVLGDLNRRVGNRCGENHKERRVIDFYPGRRLCA